MNFTKNICKNINSSKYKFIIGGSYVTTKINPNDIDFLIALNTSKLSEEEYEFIKKEDKKQEILNKLKNFHLNKVKKV